MMKIKKIFISLLVMMGLTACSVSGTTGVSSMQTNKNSFVLEFVNNTNEEMKEVKINYYVNGDLIGVNGSYITSKYVKQGESLSNGFEKNDFPSGTFTHLEFEPTFVLKLNGEDTEITPGQVATLKPEYGKNYVVSLEGNSEDGYYLDTKMKDVEIVVNDYALRRKSVEMLDYLLDGNYEEFAMSISLNGLRIARSINLNDNNILLADGDEFMESIKANRLIDDVGLYTGDPEQIYFQDYLNSYFRDFDYRQGKMLVCESLYSSSAIDNLLEYYPNCPYVEFYVPSKSRDNDMMDWTLIRFVFEKKANYELVAMIHGSLDTCGF